MWRLIDENIQKMLKVGISPKAFADQVIEAIQQDVLYVFSDSNLFSEMQNYLNQLNDVLQKFLANTPS